jgi:hypothetical protein
MSLDLGPLLQSGLRNVQADLCAGKFTLRQVVEHYLQVNREKKTPQRFFRII